MRCLHGLVAIYYKDKYLFYARAAYRRALNDEVKRKLRVIFNVLLFQNISTL